MMHRIIHYTTKNIRQYNPSEINGGRFIFQNGKYITKYYHISSYQEKCRNDTMAENERKKEEKIRIASENKQENLKQRNNEISIYQNNIKNGDISKKALEDNNKILPLLANNPLVGPNKHPSILMTICNNRQCWNLKCWESQKNCGSELRIYAVGHFSNGSYLTYLERRSKIVEDLITYTNHSCESVSVYFYLFLVPWKRDENKFSYVYKHYLTRKAQNSTMIQEYIEKNQHQLIPQDFYFKKIAAQEAREAQQVQNLNHDELD